MVFRQTIGEWQKKGEVGREISKIAKSHYLACMSHRLLFPRRCGKPMNKQATVSSGGERRTFPTAWRWQVSSQVSASLERGIPKVPVRSSSLRLRVTPSTGKTGNALTPSQGDVQHAWGLLTKLTEKVRECQNHHRKRRGFRQHQWGWREGHDPAPAHSAAKTPVDANGSNAGLKGEE